MIRAQLESRTTAKIVKTRGSGTPTLGDQSPIIGFWMYRVIENLFELVVDV